MIAAPLAIGNSRELQRLRLRWSDGREQHIDHVLLRRQCPCSQCRAFRLKGMKPVVAASVHLVEINPQGYGLQLVFSDGHQRGIYPWAYLAELSDDPVSDCARRAEESSLLTICRGRARPRSGSKIC